MTNDEAEKLARKTITTMQQELGMANIEWREIRKLCDYVLSGNMKREIENAAYRRSLSAITDGTCDSLSEAEDRIRGLIKHASDCAVYNGPALPVAACDCGSLIQPPAQKEDGR